MRHYLPVTGVDAGQILPHTPIRPLAYVSLQPAESQDSGLFSFLLPPMRTRDDGTMTAREAASALGVGVSTVHRMCDALELPVHRTAGGHRRIPRDTVAALASAARPEGFAA